MNSKWIAEESRLWNKLMDNRIYYVRKPTAYELSKLTSKKRAKRIEKYKNDKAEALVLGWKNYHEFIRHMPA